MALPALITDFNKQTVNYGVAVGESLQKLGQQVGQTLAMQEYQKQAAELAPQLSETYKAAYTDIASGTSEGLARGMGTLIDVASRNPQLYSNPILAQMNQQAAQFGKEAADLTIALRVAQLRYGGGGGGDEMTPEQMQEFLSFGQTPAEETDQQPAPTGQVKFDVRPEELPVNQPSAIATPGQQPPAKPVPEAVVEILPEVGRRPTTAIPSAVATPPPPAPKLEYDSQKEKPKDISKALSALTGTLPSVVIPKTYQEEEFSQTRGFTGKGQPTASTTRKVKDVGEKQAEEAQKKLREYEGYATQLGSDSRLANLIAKNGIDQYNIGTAPIQRGIPGGIQIGGTSTETRLYGPDLPSGGYLLTNEMEKAFNALKGFQNEAGGYGIKFLPMKREAPKPTSSATPAGASRRIPVQVDNMGNSYITLPNGQRRILTKEEIARIKEEK